MKYLIYSTASKEWFLAPGRGLTDKQDDAYRFTKKEAEREVALRYNCGCRIEPLGYCLESHSNEA